MARVADVTREALDPVDLIEVEVEKETKLGLLEDDCGEVAQAFEGDVELEVLALNVITQRQDVALQRLKDGAKLGWHVLQPFDDGFVRVPRLVDRELRADRQGIGPDGIDQFHQKQVRREVAVADQVNVAVDLLDGMGVVLCEVGGDADQPRGGPINVVRGLLPQRSMTSNLNSARWSRRQSR